MFHPIYRIGSFEILGPYTLKVGFDDQTMQVIDFEPVLVGDIYGPLRDLSLFNQVTIDPEVHTLVWPNGADFDPATLHDWHQHLPQLKAVVQEWRGVEATYAEGRSVEPEFGMN